MKFFLVTFLFVLSTVGFVQSGRRLPKPVPQPTPAVEAPTPQPKPSNEPPPVTAEKNEDYRCTEDGTLERIIDKQNEPPNVFSPKAVDVRAEITDRPKPSYTREANRAGIQGHVILKALLTSAGEVDRVRVVRRLPYGLTENAIRVACKIRFKPAMKDGQQVSQWLDVEYTFRLADSSIYRQ